MCFQLSALADQIWAISCVCCFKHCVCVCVNACTWRLTLPASHVHIRWFASATQQFYLPTGYAQTFSPSRTGSAARFLFPQGERKGMRQQFFLPAREARTVLSFTVNMQGAQARLGYLCQRSYSKMGERWSDQPPVPASMASPKHP